MLNEMRKSIQSILYERITSPLSGALFISWFAWNWKIPYILLFNKSDLTIKERLIFIQEHINVCDGLLYPIISAIAIITVYPLLTTGALFVWMKYKKWQRNIKNNIEKTELLSQEESNQIRFEMLSQEEKINNLMRNKEKELEIYKDQIDILRSQIKEKEDTINEIYNDKKSNKSEGIKNIQKQYTIEFEDLKMNNEMFNYFNKINNLIQRRDSFYDEIDADTIGYYVSHNIIVPNDKSNNLIFNFTEKGNHFVKLWYDQRYNKS